MNVPPARFEVPSDDKHLAPPLPGQGFIRLTPLNQRRLANFRSNQRGYWSFWIFMVVFIASLFAEFIANDRPIFVFYKGEALFPIFRDYPEEKFGGFLAHTEYRSKVIRDEINAHGFMIWPPIHYSYQTQNPSPPKPAPSPPTWLLSEEECQKAAAKVIEPGQPNRGCEDIEWNWLGTDDSARDVAARLIYGLRISILFGLALASVSSVVGVAAEIGRASCRERV